MTLYDPLAVNTCTTWFPANNETQLLIASLLACRDVARLLGVLQPDPLSDRHGMLLLATPAISLADNTLALQAATGRLDISAWPSRDRSSLRELGRSLRRLSTGPLRRLRNTLSAHHNPFAAAAVPVVETAPLVLRAVPEALCVLILLLNHQGVFAWSRRPVADRSDVVELFGANPIFAPAFRTEDNQIVELLGLTMMPDPKEEAQDMVRGTLAAYNIVAARARLPEVSLTESNGPPANRG